MKYLVIKDYSIDYERYVVGEMVELDQGHALYYRLAGAVQSASQPVTDESLQDQILARTARLLEQVTSDTREIAILKGAIS